MWVATSGAMVPTSAAVLVGPGWQTLADDRRAQQAWGLTNACGCGNFATTEVGVCGMEMCDISHMAAAGLIRHPGQIAGVV